ncbi:MAG: PadR family transcriptional regulator [Gemmatimonadota bacterium]|nr:PadR family transcriptional regulator [Gemmatimonadota bacterium]
MESPLPLLRGTLDMLIMKTLSLRPMHGYAIAGTIRGATDEVLAVEEGSLYPALHRMEKRGWIEGEWIRSDTGHRARQYSLTPEGRERLALELRRWERFQVAAGRVIDLDGLATG